MECLASCGSWLAQERILVLDRTREDWQHVSVCDEVLKSDVGKPATSTVQPRRQGVAPPVLSGAERAAEVGAVIAHCKAMLAHAGDEGVTQTSLKSDLLLFNPGAAGDAVKLLRIDPEITETRERRPSNTGNGSRYRPWQVILRLL